MGLGVAFKDCWQAVGSVLPGVPRTSLTFGKTVRAVGWSMEPRRRGTVWGC